MSQRRRLARLERQMGLHGGPLMRCPRCEGSGLDDTEARMAILIPRRLNEITAEFYADDPDGAPPPLPDPVELPLPVACGMCQQTGLAGVEAVRVAELRAEVGGERVAVQLLATVDRLEREY